MNSRPGDEVITEIFDKFLGNKQFVQEKYTENAVAGKRYFQS